MQYFLTYKLRYYYYCYCYCYGSVWLLWICKDNQRMKALIRDICERSLENASSPPGSPLLSCHPIPSPSSASVHHPDHVGQPAPCPHLSTEGSTTNNSRSINYFAACIIYVRNRLLGSEHPVCRCWRLKDVKTLFYCPQEVWGRSGSRLLVWGPSSHVTHAIHDHWTVCG